MSGKKETRGVEPNPLMSLASVDIPRNKKRSKDSEQEVNREHDFDTGQCALRVCVHACVRAPRPLAHRNTAPTPAPV